MTEIILIIDDSEDDQRLYRRALKDSDYKLEMASTADAGFARMDNIRPALILLDYNLPDADGLSVINRLSEYTDLPVPIIMLTGEGNAAVAVEVMKHGADDYLVKDTEGRYLRHLPDVIRRVLSSHEQRNQANLLRQKAEELLRRNQILMQNSMDGVHIMDIEGNVIEANNAFCRMLGYTQEEALKLNVADWDAHWTREELRERFKWLIGKDAQFETEHRRKDGAVIQVEISSSGIEIGGKAYLYAASRDISERKRTEQALRESEERYHSLFSNMLDGFAYCKIVYEGDIARDFVYLEVNPAFERHTGLKDVVGKKVSEVIPGIQETNPELFEVYGRVASTGEPARYESYLPQLGYWFFVTVYSPEQGYFVAIFSNITERKRSEAAMQRYKLVLDTAIDGFWVTDLRGNLLEANEAYAKMSGYMVDELIGMHISQLDAVENPQDVKARIANIMRDGHDRFETRHRRKDGKILDIEISVNLMRESEQLFVFCRDISQRKQMEGILARYKAAVVDVAMDGFWLTDLQGNLLEVNAAYAQMSGYSVDELIGMHVSQLDANGGLENIRAHAANLASLDSNRFETRHRRKDGTLLDIEMSITLMQDTQQLFIFNRNITEHKLIQAAISRSEANLHAILDNSPYLTWLKDVEGRYITVNKVFADFLHLAEPRQAEGKTDLDLQPKELAEKYRADDAEVMAGRRQKHIIEPAFDGERTLWVESYKTPIIADDGKVLGTVGFAKDVTDHKRAEEEMRIAAVAFETHDAIVITDDRASIVRANQAFTDITGYRQDEVLGKNPRIMSSGRQDKAFYLEMWQQLLHTGSWAGEIWDKRKNGQIYPKWLTITAVKNERQETTHYVAIFSDITARKQSEEEIRNLAFYDALTRLPNRRLFMDRFRAALTISTRRNDYGAVLFIDLDRFKTLNDTLGHDYGDMLLIEVAARIKSCVREMDTVARLGGDEFVVLIEGISEEQDETSRNVGLIAEKIRETLAHPYRLKSHEHHSSPSIGISLYHGHQASVDELLQQADMAMYQAKGAGRNAVRFFDPVMQHNVATRAELENDLHHAIALGQLQLHYQVQVDGAGHPQGAEALLRWFHPQRGLVMPGQFIPIAEESTLILSIGHWVLEQACQQLARWAGNERMRGLTLAVNVSAKQFAQPNFVDQVAGSLGSHGASAPLLKLELTESLVLHDLKNTVNKMHALKELGVKLSLDDFGTGYSSLSYLKQLPLDQIKIDQGFVHGIAQDGNDALLVQTIIDLAGNFRLNVIAEGVETEGQLAFLKNSECAAFQGYLFGKAVPLEEFEELVDRL